MFELAVVRVEKCFKLGIPAPEELISTVEDVLNFLVGLARRNGKDKLEDFMPEVSNLFYRPGLTSIKLLHLI